MGYKVLTKQQWDSLPAYNKYQMRANFPDLYNYYQKRYEPKKVEPVTQKRTIEAEQEPVVWKDYDLDGDGYLSPSEYSAYTDAGGITTNAVPRITQAQLDALEQESEPASAVDDEGQAPLDPAVVKYVNKFLEDNGLEPSKWPAGNSITNRDGSPLDADGDGIISPAELRAANITPEAGFNADFFNESAVDDEGQAPLDPAVVKYVNKFLEDNGLEPSKWPAGNSITNRDGSPLDADGDGIISPAELRAANITPEAGFNADFFNESASSDNWWDVADPKAFFGVQGERTDEQKDRVQQFRQEWGNVRGAAAVNGLVDGTYTADQLSQNWGAENLASVIKAETFKVGEFNEGDDFGAFLESQFTNVAQFTNPSGEGIRGTLGTISAAPLQTPGSNTGNDRGVQLTAARLAQADYMQAIRAAAETADVPLYVDGPAHGSYELNLGQYDDVPLGAYHTVREPDSPLEVIFEAVLKWFVTQTITTGLGTDLAAFGKSLAAAEESGDFVKGVGEALETIGTVMNGTASSTGGGTAGSPTGTPPIWDGPQAWNPNMPVWNPQASVSSNMLNLVSNYAIDTVINNEDPSISGFAENVLGDFVLGYAGNIANASIAASGVTDPVAANIRTGLDFLVDEFGTIKNGLEEINADTPPDSVISTSTIQEAAQNHPIYGSSFATEYFYPEDADPETIKQIDARQAEIYPMRKIAREILDQIEGIKLNADPNSPEDQAGLSGLGRIVSWAESAFEDYSDIYRNVTAANLKATGGILEGIAAVSVLWGENPLSTTKGAIGRALSSLGGDAYSPEVKKGVKEIGRITGNARGWEEKAEAYYGAISDYPLAFLTDTVLVETLQEGVPFVIGGLAGTTAKGAALLKGVATDVAERIGSKAGFNGGVIADLTESGFMSMGSGYDEALESLLYEEAINPKTDKPWTQKEADELAQILIEDKVVNKATGKVYTAQEIERLREGLVRRSPINPDTGKIYTQAEAEEAAQTIGIGQGIVGLVTTSISMLMGGNALEAKVFLDKIPNADEILNLADDIVDIVTPNATGAIKTSLKEIGRRLFEDLKGFAEWQGAGVVEWVTETAEEVYQNVFLENALWSYGDKSRDFSGNTFENGLVGGIAAKGVADVMAGSSLVSDALFALNPEINEVVNKGLAEIEAGADPSTVAKNIQESLNGFGIEDKNIQTDFANAVNNEGYTTREEAGAKFDEAGYEFTEEELAQYTGELNEADTLNNIDTYVDPRQVTVDEAKAELIAQGITDPSDAEIAAYVGQGDETFQQGKYDELETYADPRVVTEAEVEAELIRLGIENPSGDLIEQYSGQGDETFQQGKYAELEAYADPRVVTEAEAEAALIAQGLSAEDAKDLAKNYAGQGGEDFETTIKQDINDDIVTEQELIDAAVAAGLGTDYELTPEDRELIGVVDEGTTAADVLKTHTDDVFTPAVNVAEAAKQKADAETAITAAVTAAGAPALSPTDLERYVAMVIGGGLTIADTVQKVKDDIEAAVAAAGGDNTDTEGDNTDTEGDNTDTEGDNTDTEGDNTDTEGDNTDTGGDITIEGDTNDYVRVGDFNIKVTALQENVLAAINKLVNNGSTLDAAIAEAVGVAKDPVTGEPTGLYKAIGGLATEAQVAALKKVVDGIANTLGTAPDGSTIAREVALIKDRINGLVTATHLDKVKDDLFKKIRDELIGGVDENGDPISVDDIIKKAVGVLKDADGNPTGLYAELAKIAATDPTAALTRIETTLGTLKEDILNDSRISDLVTEKELQDAFDLNLGKPPTYTDGKRDPQTATGIYANLATLTDLQTLKNEFITTVKGLIGTAINPDTGKPFTVDEALKVAVGVPKDADGNPTGIYKDLAGINTALVGEGGIKDIVADIKKDMLTDADLADLVTKTQLETAIGSPAGEGTEDTGIFKFVATKTDLANLRTDVVSDIKALLFGENAVEGLTLDEAIKAVVGVSKDPVTGKPTGLYEDLAGIDVTVDDIKTIVTDIQTNMLTDADLANLVTKDQLDTAFSTNIGSFDDGTGIYKYVATKTELSNLEKNLIQRINDSLGATNADGTPKTIDQIIKEAVGVPADANGNPTGLYKDVAGIDITVDDIKTVVDGIATTLGTTASEVTAIKTALENNLGAPSVVDAEGNITTEATGIYGIIEGLATKTQVSDVEKSILAKIKEYTDAGFLRDEALQKAINDVATDLGTTKEAITKQLTDFKSDLATEIATLATKVQVSDVEKSILAKIKEYTDAGFLRDEALQKAINDVATDLGTTKEAITKQLTDFKSDLATEIAALATKVQVSDVEKSILAKMKEYTDAGMDRDKALQKALDEANTNIDQLAEDLGTTKEAITQQLTDFQTKLDADLALLATKKQVNDLETELYLKLVEYEAQGKTRDEATQLAIADLATDLETTEENLMTRLGVTQDTLTNRINEVETNLTNQFNEQIKTTQDLITDTAIRDSKTNTNYGKPDRS
jgi:hypothetical protein